MSLAVTHLVHTVISQAGDHHFPPQASNWAAQSDAIYWFVYWLCVFFFVLLMGATGYFAVRYRRIPGRKTGTTDHNSSLEFLWSAIPSVLFLVMFVWGWKVFLPQTIPPDDALDVRVTARKWHWSLSYPEQGIGLDNALVVPVGQPVRLTMSSTDVIHSFFVPAFRLKRDVLPNRYTTMWFTATEAGEYDLFCTEYCGRGHSLMLGRVTALEQDEFDNWVVEQQEAAGPGSLTPAEWGEQIFQNKGCSGCHSMAGARIVGPALNEIWDTDQPLADGSSVHVDDNYIRESVMMPMAKIVEGYPGVMPTFAGQLNDDEMNALIEYIKSAAE